MALQLSHLDGPLAGKTASFADDKGRIVFGRDPSHCDVVWPPDFTAVSRQHFALVRTTGGYRFELGDAPVLVNGERAYQDQLLTGDAELQLGDERGPRMNLQVAMAGTAAAMAATKKYDKNVSAYVTAQRSHKRLRVVAGIVAVVAVAVAGAFFWISQVEEQTVNLAQFVESQPAVESAAVSPDVLNRVRDSVYLVLVRNVGGAEVAAATAWVVGDGVLATNAHVGEIFSQIGPGMELLVRSPARPFETHVVTGVKIHPGYHAFDTAVAEYSPVVMDLYGGVGQPRLVPAYDVALMYVDNGDTLSAPLKLADDASLTGLLPGLSVAYVGYPTEQLSNVDNVRAPNPTVQSGGTLVGVTDYFNVRREDDVNHLVQHNLGATGGASGSPIFDGKGEVVAVLSGGNIIITPEGRAPSAVGINFAQRADLVRELLDDTADEKLVEYQKIWAEGLALFDNFRSVLPRVLLADLKRWVGGDKEPTALLDQKGEIGPMNEGWGVMATVYELEVEPGVYGFYAIADREDDVNIAVIQDGTVLAINNETDWHPIVGTQVEKGGAIQVVVFSNAEKAPYQVRGYGWPGTTRQQASR